MTQAEEAAKQAEKSENLIDDDEEHNINAEDFDIEGFLKEGGINLEDVDEIPDGHNNPNARRKES